MNPKTKTEARDRIRKLNKLQKDEFNEYRQANIEKLKELEVELSTT